MSLYVSIGASLRRARQRLGWSQAYLGERLGVSHAAISDIERGKTKSNLDDLALIATTLKTDWRTILMDADASRVQGGDGEH